jgi:hypothetical protein
VTAREGIYETGVASSKEGSLKYIKITWEEREGILFTAKGLSMTKTKEKIGNVCDKCSKGLHGQCFPEFKCTM